MSQPTPSASEPTEPYTQQPYAQQPSGPQGYAQQPSYPQGYGQPPATAYGDQYGYGGYPPVPSRPNNTMAMVALISGICGLTVVPFIGSIVAVITGMMAKKEIARTGEEGSGLATWGVVLGWIGIGLGIALVLFFLLVFGTMFAAIGSSAS